MLDKIMKFIKSFVSPNGKTEGDKGKNNGGILTNVIIVIIIGVILIIAGSTLFNKSPQAATKPDKSGDTNIEEVGKIIRTDEKSDLEKKIEMILAKIKGAGDVSVMITYVSSKEVVPAYDSKVNDSEIQEKDSGGGTRTTKQNNHENSVAYQDQQGGGKQPIILKELEPQVMGVVIVAEGASDEAVKERLCRAVQALLDIPLHRIQVFEKEK